MPAGRAWLDKFLRESRATENASFLHFLFVFEINGDTRLIELTAMNAILKRCHLDPIHSEFSTCYFKISMKTWDSCMVPME